MQLKLDKDKKYAIALEGGGARGSYEIGVWQALEEAGLQYRAVAGTSVGALNGALMAMRDLERAKKIWSDIHLSQVIALNEEEEDAMRRVLRGERATTLIPILLPKIWDAIAKGGLDVNPLRNWIRRMVDVPTIKSSDVELFVTTLSLPDWKGMEIKINDLADDDVCDMLLASAYHPTFRHEKFKGKMYTDGGFFDSLPLHVLIENGYKDIIAVHLPTIGVMRNIKIPSDVRVFDISSKRNLGNVLNFDFEQARRNMVYGYLDAKRLLYGLVGNSYYIDRTLSEKQAMDILTHDCLSRANDGQENLQNVMEHTLPALRKTLGVRSRSYYSLLTALTEKRAQQKNIPQDTIYTDTELWQRTGGEGIEIV